MKLHVNVTILYNWSPNKQNMDYTYLYIIWQFYIINDQLPNSDQCFICGEIYQLGGLFFVKWKTKDFLGDF